MTADKITNTQARNAVVALDMLQNSRTADRVTARQWARQADRLDRAALACSIPDERDYVRGAADEARRLAAR